MKINLQAINPLTTTTGRVVCAAVVAGAALLFAFRRRVATTIRNTVNGSYFTISELCRSDTAAARGIDNTPPPEVQSNLQALITNLLDPIRERYGAPITVTSGYRCAALNKAVGGVTNSQHLTGQAADLQGTNGNNAAQLREICRAAVDVDRYDQLIIEHSGNTRWIHVSFGPGNRREILLMKNGKYTTLTKQNWQNYI